MIEEYKTEGFVFKKEDRLEADKVFSIFTKDFGKIEVVGKAIRKINSKLRANIEIFSLSKIEFIQGKNKKTLIDALLIEPFKSVKNVPEKLEVAYRISDVLDQCIKGQEKDDGVFNLIVDTFEKLNEVVDNKVELVYLYFFWNFICILGYGPQILSCGVCNGVLEPESLYFSCQEGGVICVSCFKIKKHGAKVSSDIVKILRLFLKKDWDVLLRLKIVNNDLKLLQKISEDYLRYITSHYHLKSFSVNL